MDKNAIKKYAVWARRELIERVSQRAMIYGITAADTSEQDLDSVNGRMLSPAEKRQRQALIRNIKSKGYDQIIEEVAYTWFNRFAALRFMEVNGYLPSHVRVFTNDEGKFKPQILAEAIHLELDGLDMNRVYELENANKTEELFKYLLIVQCNALSGILPGMFQRIDDYTELLLPDYLLREGGVIEQMVTTISEEDWADQVQIIGWLYQYYNSEKKDEVFAALKRNVKITKENIPAATQLFTPDWIVRYMVENSLGRLWVEGHPSDELKSGWKYYLEEAEQEPDVQAQLVEIRREYADLTPEQIKCIDPCCGSGHILVYMFDVLVQIYESYGYTAREAVRGIIENNLYGLDIDDRAVQLAYFAVMMKARQYDRRFFSHPVQPMVYCTTGDEDGENFGSLVTVDNPGGRPEEPETTFEWEDYEKRLNIWNYRSLLAQKYDVVCTNPPYMGSRKSMNPRLKKYVEHYYPDSKSDLCTVFIEKCLQMSKANGFAAMVTQQSFMFTDDYKELRAKLLLNNFFVSMAHLGSDSFPDINGEVVQTTSFIFKVKCCVAKYNSLFARLVDFSCDEKVLNIQNTDCWFYCSNERFRNVKAMPFSYWLSDTMRSSFDIGVPFEEYGNPRAGITTGENDRFMRNWHEVIFSKIGLRYKSVVEFHMSGKLYIPYNKGGRQIRWYGNNDFVLMFDEKNYNILSNQGNHLPSRQYYCKRCITWSDISGRSFAARYCDIGTIFDVKGSCGFPDDSNFWLSLAFLNSKLTPKYIDSLNPTTTTQVGDLKRIPVIAPEAEAHLTINILSQECVEISKWIYDKDETSWDFQRHPLVRNTSTVAEAYTAWERECAERFDQLKANEEELNRIFIDIYGLQDELTPEVEDKDVTVRKADLGRDIRSLISYAVGCMFGRYSLDKPGLIFAGGDFGAVFKKDHLVDENGNAITLGGVRIALGAEHKQINVDGKWVNTTFYPDTDNIIPICDDDYFQDDITARFVKFIEAVYGKDTLEENLRFIAEALGGKGAPREVLRSYFLNDFYADHLKIYQKRPIYWLFDSGKKNGFKALIYMHCYQPDTIARIRTDYVHEQQSRYRTAIADLEQRMSGASTSERVKLSKQLTKLQAQAEEIRVYEEKVHHLADQMIKIDLDDGVKKNYAIFGDVLAKIK